MEEILARYGLSMNDDISVILETLKEKQLACLDKLDIVELEERRIRLQRELEEIESVLEELEQKASKIRHVDFSYADAVARLNSGELDVAIEMLTTLADMGEGKAMWKLGCFYSRRDAIISKNWFLKSIQAGYVKSMQDLGRLLENQGNVVEAVEWYLKGANQGIGYCKKCLKRLYITQKWLPEDEEIFIEWYQAAAEAGDKEAQKNMGDIYFYGIGIPKDHKLAIYWYKKAAKQGDEYSSERLYAFLQQIKASDEREDKLERIHIQSILKNSKASAVACLVEGDANCEICEQLGAGAMPILKEYGKAASLGNKLAAKKLGDIYREGKYGVEPYTYSAVEYYEMAACKKTPKHMLKDYELETVKESRYLLGLMYEEAASDSNDLQEALKWYKMAEELGDLRATYRIGMLSAKDQAERGRWILMAAEHGDAKSQMKLAEMYEEGIGVPMHLKEARKWYAKALENGVKEAQEPIERIDRICGIYS